MQKAVIYCRVSTEEQAETGHSLETQEKFCRQFAQRSGYAVVGVYRDEGKSGTTLDRPALRELLLRIQKNNSVQAVIVQETDRLARNTKDHLTIRALLEKGNVKLISVAQPMLDDSPEGKMIDTIIASVNQFQSDINSRKIKKGLKERFDQGWWPNWAPFGYITKLSRDNKKIVVPDPVRWRLLRQGLKLYLTGNYSALEITDILYEKGLKSKGGKKICNSIMTHILRNPFYAGIMIWKGEKKMGRHKPMITAEEYKRIIHIIDAHNLHACRRRKYSFLLRGFVFCNICGGRYTSEKHPLKNNIAYYHCNWRGDRGKKKLHTNEGQNVHVDELERQVRERFKGIEFSKEFTTLIIERVKKLYAQKKEASEVEKRILSNQRMAIERKRNKAEEKLLSGVISDNDFGRIKAKLDENLIQLQDQLDKLEERHNYDIEVIREILMLTRNVYRSYKTAPYELKRHFLALFWEKFLVQDKKIVCAIPTKLIQMLCENRQVIIKDQLSSSPKLVLTLLDSDYLLSLREKLDEIKRLQKTLVTAESTRIIENQR
jgi:DNA invertase Pin-like site-specific DNA recombinase